MFRFKSHLAKTRDILSLQVENHIAVMDVFDLLFAELVHLHHAEVGFSESEIYHVLNAAEYAIGKHHKQTRKDRYKTPYIFHPLRVARHLLLIGKVYDSEVIMAALLHDVIEDTDATAENVQEHFGYRVKELVEEVSDDKSLSYKERKQLQITNAKKRSKEASLIILADKLSNLADLLSQPPNDWSNERISNYFLWAKTVINHLPESNLLLKNAIDEVMFEYWQNQIEH